MLDLSRWIRRRAWLVLGCLLLWGPSAARAEQVVADLDRDGKADIVSLNSEKASVLHVWLSKTNTFRQLHTSQPILGFGVFDIDGDGHKELIAADVSIGFHVWRTAAGGHLHRAHPRPTKPSVHAGTSGRFGEVPNPTPAAVLVETFSPPAHGVCPAFDTPGVLQRSVFARESSTSASHTLAVPALRGPPLTFLSHSSC